MNDPFASDPSMEAGRLPTALWVQAHLRRCHADGIPVYVLRKGEADGGMVVLKLTLTGPGLDPGSRVFSQSRDMQGRLGWLAGLGGATVPNAEADAYIARQVDRDPDLWVIEVESRDGTHPFLGRAI